VRHSFRKGRCGFGPLLRRLAGLNWARCAMGPRTLGQTGNNEAWYRGSTSSPSTEQGQLFGDVHLKEAASSDAAYSPSEGPSRARVLYKIPPETS
jgi:hypothetical protein